MAFTYDDAGRLCTPFALYYYSAYAPLLSAPSGLQATAWLPAFFLPHLLREIVLALEA